MSRLLALLAAVTVVALCLPSAAAAELRPDPDAPPGASVLWLPEDEWVQERWSPFDEEELTKLLRMDRGEVYRYLKYGGGNLLDLARRQRVSTKGLGARLLASRRRALSPSLMAEMRRRTEKMLTQRHLAEHVIGHSFHHYFALFRFPEPIFGATFRELDPKGVPIPEIARRNGIGLADLRGRIMGALGRYSARGVALGAMSPRQARLLRYWHRFSLDEWMPLQAKAARAASAGGSGPKLLCRLAP